MIVEIMVDIYFAIYLLGFTTHLIKSMRKFNPSNVKRIIDAIIFYSTLNVINLLNIRSEISPFEYSLSASCLIKYSFLALYAEKASSVVEKLPIWIYFPLCERRERNFFPDL